MGVGDGGHAAAEVGGDEGVAGGIGDYARSISGGGSEGLGRKRDR